MWGDPQPTQVSGSVDLALLIHTGSVLGLPGQAKRPFLATLGQGMAIKGDAGQSLFSPGPCPWDDQGGHRNVIC